MNESSPLVSIGVAVYNEERFLFSALESLVSQDYPNIEIIICDNASTDKTGEICQSFTSHYSHIHYYRSDRNLGAYANGCSVIEKSNGKYFMYAAGHDLWHPTYVSKAVRTMERDQDIVLCYARTMRVDTNNNPLGLAKNAWDLRGMSAASRVTYLVNNISGGDPCYGIVRLQHLKAFNARNLGFMWGLDQVMLAYYALSGTIAHIPEPLFYLRMTDNENVEVRKKSVPLDYAPDKSQKMLNMSMTELWRQMGEATLQVVNFSGLPMTEKLACKDEVRKCFSRRYGVQWNEVIPAELKSEGKNVLLTTSAAPGQTPFSTNEKRPPLGVGFLISTLREAGHNVFFIDNYLNPSNFLGTDYLMRHQIDFVGIYTNTICFRDSLRMFYRLEELRQRGLWKGKIIAGGPHASVNPESIPPFVDHIVIGEGEYALRDIVAGRVQERIVQYPAIENLDELPMPAWDYFADMPYDWGGNWLPEAPVFTMNSSRGCPFSCTFCSVHAIWGKRYTCMSAERIVADIEHLITTYGARGIYFREDNFTLDKKRLTRFCELMLERNIKVPWVCETRVDSLDESTVELMTRAGAKGFYIGVESGSQRLLDFMKKGISVEQIKDAFHLAHRHGIMTAASIIVGLPTETEQDLRETCLLLEEIAPDVTWFNVFVGLPDSPMYRYAIDNNLYDFIDDRGLVYLKGHDRKVESLYNDAWDAGCPVRIENGAIQEPAISIIMSVYNKEKYLKKAIRSILGQTFPDFEFIIVDDCSTDNSPAILASFNDPRIRVITNDSNIGLTRSLNKAIAVSRAPLIARMDADDFCAPHRLKEQYNFLSEHPDYGLVGSSYYVLDDSDTPLSITQVLTDHERLYPGLEQQNWFAHGSVLFRKSAFYTAGGYDEFYTYAQDYDLWLRLSETTRVANLAESLYHWRKVPDGISQEKAAQQKRFADLAREKACARRYSNNAAVPLVSVIVPTFNRPEMLANALQSIMAQTFGDFEVIVANDAGVDVAPLVNHF
ncbi:MAG: glycosyltransferase, partial [Geobacteraceae bacterium]